MIHYVKGDVTNPTQSGVIAHVVNNRGGWGKGLVLAISKRWSEPETEYRLAAKSGELQLGTIQTVRVAQGLWVANMVAQAGYATKKKPQAVNYVALRACLDELAYWCRAQHVQTVLMPRIGCGLGGGSWDAVEPLVQAALDGLSVYVYDLELV